MITAIREFFIGRREKGYKVPTPTFTTVQPTQSMNQQEWFNTFRVGMLYEKKAYHID